MITRRTQQRIDRAETFVTRLNRGGVRDRPGFAIKGLQWLKKVRMTNGEYTQMVPIAERLAESLERDYQDPKKGMAAAAAATEIKAFARGITPFGSAKIEIIDTLCLA